MPIGLVLILLVLTQMQRELRARRARSTSGPRLVTAAAFGVIWALMRGNSAGWASAEVLLALAGGVS